ncbi:hypothetical protein [Pseudomonas trivialis]|uniref:OspG family effector kinase n=1 Tax=Pseudomonas trivialis TaxID=200450 RepID=UPI000B102F7B|nr:hypothetical protein [Pseudomonas trivialis]
MTIITRARVFTPSITPAAHLALVSQPSPTAERSQLSTLPNSTITLDNPAALKRAFGDSCDWKTLANQLLPIINDPRSSDAALANRLKNTTMNVCEDSSYSHEHALNSGDTVSLEAFIQGKGLNVPRTLAELGSLNQRVTRQAQVHPLGNFSGALSWPLPPSNRHQRSIVTLLQGTTTQLPGLPFADERKGTLGYLLSGSAVSNADLQRPTVAIEKLLGSPKALALGQAIQTQLGGYATDSSRNDYVLAAIHLGLDPESLEDPAQNTVAGFDLARQAHWGEGPQAVIDSLGRHLLEKGRVTAHTANLGARLLLAKTAPQFLVKDIPRSVTYGSLTWAQLAIATARIEADSPGRSLNLNYAQVLAYAEQVNTTPSALHDIRQKALADWGRANGLLTGTTPTQPEQDAVRVEFNRQIEALTTASSQAQTPIPSRREMALDALKAAFPDLDPKVFEAPSLARVFRVPGRTGQFPGMRSMLDIVMHGGKLGTHEHWESADKRIPAIRFCQLFESGTLDVADAFKGAYDGAITSIEKGQQGLADYLISTLPPQDRKNLEYGQLEFFHTNDYTMAMDLFSKPTLRTRGHTLRVKTTLDGEVNIYEIDTRRATVEKQNYWKTRYTPPYTEKNLHHTEANVISKTRLFDPFKDEADQARERSPSSADTPKFGSTRSDYIGRVFAKSLDLHNEDLMQQARGVTSFDKNAATNTAIGEFFLNLIPLRSAIVNFSNGNVADGLLDLGMDFIGLVTLGAGKVAQAGKAFSKGLFSLSGVAKAARFVGAATIEAFNPLGGVGDLAAGVAGLIKKGGSRLIAKSLEGVNKLRGASASYDLLKAASQQHGAAALGTFKVAGETVECGAALHKGQWYALDVNSQRPYGSPLDAFAANTHAINGAIQAKVIPQGAQLNNVLHSAFQLPESTISGLSRNSQGVYVAANGHQSYIRHTDHLGQSAVYEVRQVTRTEEGVVQARIYHNNRQTELLVQHVQGDQWQRLGAKGGYPFPVNNDCGREIGSGAEAVLYESRDGNSVYKCYDTEVESFDINAVRDQADYLNAYYGEGFAQAFTDMGDAYIKMKKLDGVSLKDLQHNSLPVEVRALLDDAIKSMEDKGIFQGDLHLGNFLYSAKDNKIYPVDISSRSSTRFTEGVPLPDDVRSEYDLEKGDLYYDFDKLLMAA